MNLIKFWEKDHFAYNWIKYNAYKPIRNFLCHYGYGYDLSDEENTERRRKWIMSLKEREVYDEIME